MKTCIQCGAEIAEHITKGTCIECQKKNLQKIFRENPEIKQAFGKSIEEMKNPDNMKKSS